MNCYDCSELETIGRGENWNVFLQKDNEHPMDEAKKQRGSLKANDKKRKKKENLHSKAERWLIFIRHIMRRG